MTPSQQQVASWMNTHHRIVRTTPASKLPSLDRTDAIDGIVKGLRQLSHALHVESNFSNFSHTSEEQNNISPVEVLQALTVLNVQLIAAYHACGLASAATAGIYELLHDSVPIGAATIHPTDFKRVIRDIYQVD